MFHLHGKFIVNMKFVGAFVKQAKPDFVLQRVFLDGTEETFTYKHFPLPFIITKGSLKKWESNIETDFGDFVPVSDKLETFSTWMLKVKSSDYVGVNTYLSLDEAVKKTSLLVAYEFNGRILMLGRNAFKMVADKRAYRYLLPCGAFPNTIEKMGVRDGN